MVFGNTLKHKALYDFDPNIVVQCKTEPCERQ